MSAPGATGTGYSRRPPARTRSGHAVAAIRVPARSDYFVILRSVCGQLAPRLGYTPTETAELRLAVDEACALLVGNCVSLAPRGKPDGLAATFVVDGPSLRVTLAREADAAVTPDHDEFAWAILTSLVDDCAWRVEGSTVRLEIRKQRSAGR